MNIKPYYQDSHINIYNGDCRQMTELPDESVQCVVTSPPYWGLRRYSGEQDLIWGDNHCEHQWGRLPDKYARWAKELAIDCKQAIEDGTLAVVPQGNICSLCGAWKGAFGLEPNPEMYVQHTVEILREIRRVLRKDGVVFWNIGDSYFSSSATGSNWDTAEYIGGKGKYAKLKSRAEPKSSSILKPKDLCLIPFRIAIAAQEDGWWVRSVIIWSKPNPMPESVTDRPTESHEYILMLTKSARYYWDADAVREAQEGVQNRQDWLRPRTVVNRAGTKHDGRTDYGKGLMQRWLAHPEKFLQGRNIRSVWEFPTQPYPEAHFAVFPEKLPEICIKASTKPQDLVLDPFMGSGTTLWVAKKLNRRAVGYELSREYCELALDRNRQQVLGF